MSSANPRAPSSAAAHPGQPSQGWAVPDQPNSRRDPGAPERNDPRCPLLFLLVCPGRGSLLQLWNYSSSRQEQGEKEISGLEARRIQGSELRLLLFTPEVAEFWC